MEKERRRGTIAMRMRLSLKYDDQTNLAVYHWYQPETKPQAVIHLSHGMAEHILRYDDFAAFLADNGFYVIGHDHVAHGESVSDPSEIGIIKDADFMQTIINGMKLVYDDRSKSFPNCRVFYSLTAWVRWQPKGIASCFRTISKKWFYPVPISVP